VEREPVPPPPHFIPLTLSTPRGTDLYSPTQNHIDASEFTEEDLLTTIPQMVPPPQIDRNALLIQVGAECLKLMITDPVVLSKTISSFPLEVIYKIIPFIKQDLQNNQS
jgi:hypothetical protein